MHLKEVDHRLDTGVSSGDDSMRSFLRLLAAITLVFLSVLPAHAQQSPRNFGAYLQGVQHIGITVNDLNTAKEFYIDILGGTRVISGRSIQGETLHDVLLEKEAPEPVSDPEKMREAEAPDLRRSRQALDVQYVKFDNMVIELLHYHDSEDPNPSAPGRSNTSPAYSTPMHVAFHVREDVDLAELIRKIEVEARRRGMEGVKFNRIVRMDSARAMATARPRNSINRIAGVRAGGFAGISLAYGKGPCGERLEFFQVTGPAKQAFARPMVKAFDSIVEIEPVAFSDTLWTGLAVSKSGRIFVNYPRWSDNLTVSVAELINGRAVPYPDPGTNAWKPGADPKKKFVCVQALFSDDLGRLWVLDSGNPKFGGVIKDAAKLVQIDPGTNTVSRIIPFSRDTIRPDSYLNDVRIDAAHNYAYITDSGNSALVVVDLQTGRARRVLDDHISTRSEDVTLYINGAPLLFHGKKPRVHSDGIAYDKERDAVYFQALTGRTMYRIEAAALRRFNIPKAELENRVTRIGKTGAADGLICHPDGKIYISALEHNAILRADSLGNVEPVVQNEAVSWPDSFSLGPDNTIYFTTSRLHELDAPKGKFGIYRFKVPSRP